MINKTLHHQIYLSYLLITFIALGAIGWYSLSSLHDFLYERTFKDLEARANLVRTQTQDLFQSGQHRRLRQLADELSRAGGMRVTLITKKGKVIADSHRDPLQMDNHATRPEVGQALKGGHGSSQRYSHTLKEDLMYVAVPYRHSGQVTGVVRTALPLTLIHETLEGITYKIALAGLVIALIATPISLFVSRRISRPLLAMKEHAERFAKGDLRSRIHVEGPEDIDNLADALNTMAAQLDDRIRTITAQRNEQEAILASMVEGVIAVDSDEAIISINQSAARFLEVRVEEAQGRSVPEVFRHSQIQQFIREALKSREPVESDLVLDRPDEEHYLQAVGTVLKDAGDTTIGAVIVLNDVTRLRRLENVRRDFVANVSHELRTPITSIKGFVETLLSGALNEPENAERFLQIVAKQADRLNAIINDLLSLSRIEQDSEKEGIVIQKTELRALLETAVQQCNARALGKNIGIEIDCDPALQVALNPPLMEQAVVNLVDNAIKYSGDDTAIRVAAVTAHRQVVVSVKDQGRGIEREHLPRLFERFYRVDKARSRQMGGPDSGLRSSSTSRRRTVAK
ncbi:PAS/PAC sensor signal transduction histidine kinase [Nitrospina gracilis 3/211]|uniref:histidine kinase n=1 Tax=Nitrospina gracilis (strain 3/211) TaxID=1266370 RepID=M1ZB36_NITG3|nr:histidine kinase dimerization/phospho-acceptor domain-containing protein [Nitrospina gracilis]CCQ90512.1 PAS/PAC sensor signal transduction histidine kinase [Nitrospina gracilis 3/211]